MKSKFHLRPLDLIVVLSGMTAATSSAADLYWDANGATAGTGAGGVWNTASVWRQGSVSGALGNWTDGSTAVFGGTAGVVTLTAPVTVDRLNFTTTGYTVGAVSDTTRTIAFGGSYAANNPAIDAATVANATVAAKLTGTVTGGLFVRSNSDVALAASGQVALRGETNDFTGNINVVQGNLALSGVNGVYGNAANQVVLNGGGLSLNLAAASATDNLTFSRAIVVGGNGGNVATNATSGTATATFSGAVSGSSFFNRYSGPGAGTVNLALTGDWSGFTGLFENKSGATSVQTATATGLRWQVNAGTLTFSSPDFLFGGNPALWTKERLTLASGSTLALNAGGTGGFSGAQVDGLINSLTTDINGNGLLAGSGVSVNVASGSEITLSPNNSTGTGGGAVTLRISGSGKVNLQDATNTGSFVGTGGLVTLSGASTVMGGSAGATTTWENSVLRQSAGTIRVVDANNAAAATGVSTFVLGNSGYAGYELSGGKLQVTNPWRLSPRNASIVQTGGEMEFNFDGGGAAIADSRQFYLGSASFRAVLHATGGTARFNTTNVLDTRPAMAVSDTPLAAGSELTLDGNADWAFNGAGGYIGITRNAGKIGHLNLNGNSLLTTRRIIKGAGAQGRLNFNGGTVRATAAETNFLSGLDSLRIYSGGAHIDTNGHAITIGQEISQASGDTITSIPVTAAGSGYLGAPIVSISGGGGNGATAVANYNPATGTVTSVTVTSPGSGFTSAPTVAIAGGGGTGATLGAAVLAPAAAPGDFIKSGAGMLTLSGSSSEFSGKTIVQTGGMNLTGYLPNSPITVKDGASFESSPYQLVKSITLENGANLKLPLYTAGDHITVSEGINLSGGTATITPTFTGPLHPGQYVLAQSSVSGPGAIQLDFNAGGPVRMNSSLSTNSGLITLNIVSVGSNLVWTNASGDGAWNSNTSSNFLNGATADKFLGYDSVTFGPTSPAGNIELTGTLAPTAVTVNSSSDFTFQGSGSITGPATLTKQGTGTLTIANANTYTGSTYVTAGRLNVNGSLGGTDVTIDPGATLGGTGTIGGMVTIAGTVAPGNPVGTLTLGETWLQGTYECEIDGAQADKLVVNGNLDLTNSTLVITERSAPTAPSYVIATCTGTIIGSFPSVPAGWVLDTSNPRQVILWRESALVTLPDVINFSEAEGYMLGNIATTANVANSPFTGQQGWSQSLSDALGSVFAPPSSGQYYGGHGNAVRAGTSGTYIGGKKGIVLPTGTNTISFDGYTGGALSVGFFSDPNGNELLDSGDFGMQFGFSGQYIMHRNAKGGTTFTNGVAPTVDWHRFTITIGDSIGGSRYITMTVYNLGTGTWLDLNGEAPGHEWTFTATDANFGAAPHEALGGFFRVSLSAAVDNLKFTSGTPAPVSGFASWATANGVTGDMNADSDHDGVPNGIEYFMGTTGTGFTALPALDGNRTITWAKGAAYAGTYGENADYVIQTSGDLSTWTPVPVGNVTITGTGVSFTLPAGSGKAFVRLKVMGPQ
ncbi:autotransporter-associated beta strand repeat-containing protein [Luteolibacter flavescens]|uniref:Autotransporter-associated beta strand repeat-containing protein n=1 Tax=Luteolibacter flavescens TaxID=1859460 RepID=A0ABT3FNU5_9BACT|nr:autotransporter-associated beta strand repeat-containing protein [Luteolibacter flavescens]MCW1885251.1 autotransporter-associated beta strand repeat-containing protein [Luteolibacter flavescens]